MLWLDVTLVVGVVLAVAAWALLSTHILSVQRRRDAARATLDAAVVTLASMATRPAAERVAAVRVGLGTCSRELVMRAAAERDLPDHIFDTFAAVLTERWSLDSLVRDASAHDSLRSKWRRMTSLRILARLGHPQAMTLLAAGLHDADGDIASCALSLLGRSHDPLAIELLIGALGAPGLSPSRVAVFLDQSPQPLGPRLTRLLYDEQPVVRQWAATLIESYPEEPVGERLAELTRDIDPRVRKAAVQTLGRFATDDAVGCALHLLSDPVPFVRAYAARALGELGHVDHADRVAVLLGDGDWWVRLAAREALEMMGTDVWPVLVRCLDHRDRFVRNGAAEVVQNLGVLDSLIMLEAATDNPAGAKVAMLQRIAAAGGVRFTESLVERAGPTVGPRVRRLLDTIGLEHVEAV